MASAVQFGLTGEHIARFRQANKLRSLSRVLGQGLIAAPLVVALQEGLDIRRFGELIADIKVDIEQANYALVHGCLDHLAQKAGLINHSTYLGNPARKFVQFEDSCQ